MSIEKNVWHTCMIWSILLCTSVPPLSIRSHKLYDGWHEKSRGLMKTCADNIGGNREKSLWQQIGRHQISSIDPQQ